MVQAANVTTPPKSMSLAIMNVFCYVAGKLALAYMGHYR